VIENQNKYNIQTSTFLRKSASETWYRKEIQNLLRRADTRVDTVSWRYDGTMPHQVMMSG